MIVSFVGIAYWFLKVLKVEVSICYFRRNAVNIGFCNLFVEKIGFDIGQSSI